MDLIGSTVGRPRGAEWGRALAGWLRRNAVALASGLFGLLWFVAWAGPHVLDPTDIGWLMNGEDWTTHLMGWLFFRNEPMAFPLGKVSGFVYPIGTTVGYTDSLPLVSVLLRPFSSVLPDDFQFIGPWLGLCFFLQGVTGAWLVSAFTRDRVVQFAAGALFAMSPVLISRVGHDSLCAQWMLVALLGLHARSAPDVVAARRQLTVAAALVFLSAGIHPYLAVMVLALAIALALKIALVDRTLSPGRSALVALAFPAIAAGMFALFGYLGGGVSSGTEGFNRFNADLLSLLNPRGKGRLMPDLPTTLPSGEGYGYLGLGALVLAAFALLSLWVPAADRRSIPFRRAWPAALVALGFAFFALGPAAKLGGVELFSLNALYENLDAITGPFRSAGRFVWVLHYGVIAGSLVVILCAWRARPQLVALAVVGACFLQLLDFDFRPGNLFRRPPMDAGLRAPVWNEIGREYRHLALVPPQIAWTGGPCEGELPGHLRWPFAHLAYRQDMTFNGGYVARMNREAVLGACAALNDSVRRGDLDRSTLYVVGPASLAELRRSGGPAVCGRIDAYGICVSAESQGAVRRYLEAHPL